MIENLKTNIRGIIMDLDGTLFDSMKIWNHLGERFLISIGKVPKPGLSEIVYPMTLEESSRYMKAEYDIPFSEAEIEARLLGEMEKFYFDEVELKPQSWELLSVIRELGIPMAVATSSNRDHIEHAFRRLGISDYFKQIFTCYEVGEGKHSPKIYNMAASALADGYDFNPSEYIVFEDVLYCLETAKNAGFRTAAVFDEMSAYDWEKLKQKADITLDGTENREIILSKIRSI